MSEFKEKLKGALLIIDGDIDIYELPHMVLGWPNTISGETIIEVDHDVPEDEAEEASDYSTEPQDLENWEILSITNDKMIMCCGGDWQEPMKITIELVDGYLTVTKTENGIFEVGLDSEKIWHILTK